ncbi:receptor-type protein kinase, putative, partial [Bodo saltans]
MPDPMRCESASQKQWHQRQHQRRRLLTQLDNVSLVVSYRCHNAAGPQLKSAADVSWNFLTVFASRATSLSISHCIVRSLEWLNALKSLRSLSFHKCHIVCSDDEFHRFSKYLPNLKHFGAEEVTDAMLEELSLVESLRSLEMTNSPMLTNTGLRELAASQAGAHLRQLRIEGCNRLTLHGFEALAKNLLNLRRLKLRFVSDSFPRSTVLLMHVANLPWLHTLDLSRSFGLCDDGIHSISTISSLTSLNLEGCEDITDLCVMHLVSLPVLRHLDLFGCWRVTNAGLLSIGKMIELRSLSLGHC